MGREVETRKRLIGGDGEAVKAKTGGRWGGLGECDGEKREEEISAAKHRPDHLDQAEKLDDA